MAKAGRDGTAAARNGAVVRAAPIPGQILPLLRKDIIENRWKSGERLPEPQLCEEFGVSRTPLREAFKILEAEGLIRLIPHVGAVVTDPDAAEVRETMEILIALEQLAVIRLTQAREPAAVRAIERIYKDMRQAAAADDARRYYALNDDFHRAIVGGSGNRALAELHAKVMAHVRRERHRANAVEPFTVESSESHDPIVRAIVAGRAEEAGRALRRHLENVSGIMLARRSAEPARAAAAATAPADGKNSAPVKRARASRRGAPGRRQPPRPRVS